MEKLVEITTIKIKLGSKEIELTAEEARKVNKQLNDIFNKDQPQLDYPYPSEQPIWIAPYWEWARPVYNPLDEYRITCEQNTLSIKY